MSHINESAQLLEQGCKNGVTIPEEELKYLYDRIIELTFQVDKLKIEVDYYKKLRQCCNCGK